MPSYFPEVDPATGEFLSPLVTDAIDARAAAAGSVGHNHDDHYYTEAEADGRFVRTVNGAGPDGSGNVAVEAGSAVDDLDDVPDSATRVAMTPAERAKLGGIATGAEVNVNADWDAATGDAQILNKPTIPPAPPSATTTVQGIVELATTAETTAGTDAVRAVTPLGLKAVADTKQAAGSYAPAGHTHDDRYYTETEADGRFVRTVNGAGPDGAGNVTVAGEGGSTVTDATASVKGVVQLAGDLAGTADAPTVPGLAGKANTAHGHAAADVTGLATVATSGAYGDLSGKPTLGTAAAAAATAFATAAQGSKADSAVQPAALGTAAVANIGTAAGQVKPGDWKPSAADVTDSTATGRSVLTAVDGPAARSAIGAVDQADIDTAIANLVNGAPGALDTLNELSAALGGDANFAATTATALGNRLRVDAAQTLTDLQKAQARANTRAAAGIDVRHHGAAGNNSTFDTAAIQAAIADAQTTGLPLIFGKVAAGYRVDATIDIPGGIDVRMESPIFYAGPAGQAALRYNPSGGPANGVQLMLRAQRATQADWTNEDDAGIIIRNTQYSFIDIPFVRGFTRNIVALSDVSGWTYNTVRLGMLSNAKYSLDLQSTTTAGWTNENLWLGGTFRVDSTTLTTQTRYGIRIGSPVVNYLHNNNLWLKPAFEIGIGITGGAEAIPVLALSGMDNEFVAARHEGNSTIFIRTEGGSTRNVASLLTSPPVTTDRMVDDKGTAASTALTTTRDAVLSNAKYLVRAADALGQRGVAYSATQVNVPDLSWSNSSNATVARETSNITLPGGYLDIGVGRAAGFFVDTAVAKEFALSYSTETGFGGRLLVRCYDSAGAVIPHDPGVLLVRGIHNPAQTASWGGAYTTGTDSSEPTFIRVADAVQSIWIGVAKGTSNVRLKALRLYTAATRVPNSWTGFPENASEAMATQAPTFGTYRAGRQIFHGAPAVGSPRGWVCTVAGTPGTWVALPNL